MKLPSSFQCSKRSYGDNDEDVHVLKKTVEDMRVELENERAERCRIEEERQIERAERPGLEVEQARLAQQQMIDRENFQAQMAKMMSMLQRTETDYEDTSRSSFFGTGYDRHFLLLEMGFHVW